VFVGDPDDTMHKRKEVGGLPGHPEAEVQIADALSESGLPSGY